MPPKGSKSKPAKPEDDKPVVSMNFDHIVGMKVHDVQTVIKVLKSPEHVVMLKSLSTIDCFIAKDEVVNLDIVMQYNLLEILMDIVKRPELKPPCIKMVIKILNKFAKYNHYLAMLEGKLLELDFFIDIFGESHDMELVKLVFDLMYRLCRLDKFIIRFCRPDTIEKLFLVFMDQEDITLTHKCIMTLQKIVSCPAVQQYMCYMKEFQVGLLGCLLCNETLRPTIMKIFYELSKLNLTCIHQAISDTETLEKLVDMLNNKKWGSLQNQVLDILHNCLQHYNYHYQLVTSKEFLHFLELSIESKDHALACITLIVEFSDSLPARQAMYDLRIIEELPRFYKFKCSYINIKICESLALLCSSCFISEDSISNLYIKELGKMMNLKNMPWIPYRQAPVFPLYTFLNANNSLAELYKVHNIFKNLKESLIHRDELDKMYFNYVIKLYGILLSLSVDFFKYLLNRELFTYFLSNVKTYFADNAVDQELKTFVSILLLILVSEKYRRLFLELKMHNYLYQYLKAYELNVNRSLLEFMRKIIKYSDISRALVKTRIVLTLEKISCGEPSAQKALCKTLIEDLYESDLTIKFYETNELSPHDVIKKVFVTNLGPKPRYFPYGEPPTVDKLSEIHTMVVVCMDDSIPYTEGTDTNIENCGSNYLRNDARLHLYVKQVREIMKTEELNELTPKKIERLAKFVCEILSANTSNINNKLLEHRYQLKRRLNSNHLPLGLIHVGGLIERALLFKILADRCGIPCSLTRSKDCEGIAWNEIPIDCKHTVAVSEDVAVHYNSIQQSLSSLSHGTDVIEEEFITRVHDLGSLPSEGSSRPAPVAHYEPKIPKTLAELRHEIRSDIPLHHKTTLHNIKGEDEKSDPSFDANDDYYIEESSFCIRNCIVDLKENFGALYAFNSKEGFQYREQVLHEDQVYVKKKFIAARERFTE